MCLVTVMTPLWCHWKIGHTTLSLWLPGYRLIVWRWTIWIYTPTKWIIWENQKVERNMKAENKNSRNRGIKIKNTLLSVFCSTRTPEEIAKAESLRPSDSGFLPWRFLQGLWLNYIPHPVVFIIIHKYTPISTLTPTHLRTVHWSWLRAPFSGVVHPRGQFSHWSWTGASRKLPRGHNEQAPLTSNSVPLSTQKPATNIK